MCIYIYIYIHINKQLKAFSRACPFFDPFWVPLVDDLSWLENHSVCWFICPGWLIKSPFFTIADQGGSQTARALDSCWIDCMQRLLRSPNLYAATTRGYGIESPAIVKLGLVVDYWDQHIAIVGLASLHYLPWTYRRIYAFMPLMVCSSSPPEYKTLFWNNLNTFQDDLSILNILPIISHYIYIYRPINIISVITLSRCQISSHSYMHTIQWHVQIDRYVYIYIYTHMYVSMYTYIDTLLWDVYHYILYEPKSTLESMLVGFQESHLRGLQRVVLEVGLWISIPSGRISDWWDDNGMRIDNDILIYKNRITIDHAIIIFLVVGSCTVGDHIAVD